MQTEPNIGAATRITPDTPMKLHVLDRHFRRIRKGRGVGGSSSYDIRYTIPELQEILQSADYIWGFDPTTGRADLVCLASLHRDVRLFQNEKVSLSFGFYGEGIGSVKLIPSDLVNRNTPY